MSMPCESFFNSFFNLQTENGVLSSQFRHMATLPMIFYVDRTRTWFPTPFFCDNAACSRLHRLALFHSGE